MTRTPAPEPPARILSSDEVSALITSGSVSDTQADIDRLRASAELLNEQIKSLVLDNRELLLAETARIGDAAKDFQKVFLSVRSLQNVASKVAAEVAEPRALLSAKTRELADMYELVDLLRQTTRQTRLVQRIKAEFGDSNSNSNSNSKEFADLSKVARLLTEAQQAWDAADLTGIRVCEDNQRYVESTRADVRRQATELLERGVESRNQTDIGVALHALYSLEELGPSLDSLTQEMVQRVKKRFMRSLDPKWLVSGGGMGIGNIGNMGGSQQSAGDGIKVWEELEKSMDELRESAVCAWYLEKVLGRKIDLSDDQHHSHPFASFWTMAATRVKECFDAAMVARSRAVRNTLVGNYQRLAGLLEDTLGSIAKETMAGRTSAVSDELANAYYGVVSSVEAEYLQSIQTRLESLAVTAFHGSASAPLPTQVDLQGLHAGFFEEMKRAQRGGERIVTLSAAVLGTVLLTIASQARDMGDVITSTSSTVPSATTIERNVALAESVENLAKLAVSLPIPVRAARSLDGTVGVLRQTTRELLEPIFKTKMENAEGIMQKMHAVNFAAAQGAESEVASPSSYMVELSATLATFGRVLRRSLSKTLNLPSTTPHSANMSPTVASSLMITFCSTVARCWITHASLIRPLTTPGKLQLAKDAAELEASLRQLSATPIPAAISKIHDFKRLLFADNLGDVNALATGSAAGNVLPRCVVLHHLFSRLPESISSPHARNKLSAAQYYAWIEDHPEEEVLQLIKAALSASGASSSDPVVALMNTLLIG